MKSICLILSFVTCTQFVCNNGYPDEARIGSDHLSHNSLRLSNDLQIEFTRSTYHFFHKRSTIGVFCNVINRTSDTLFLNRENFTIENRKQVYLRTPFGVAHNLKIIAYPNVVKIDPNSHFEYVFSYRSQNKMSYNEYMDIIKNDTAVLNYTYDNKIEKLIDIIIAK